MQIHLWAQKEYCRHSLRLNKLKKILESLEEYLSNT